MIPVIERTGGGVLVRRGGEEVLVEGGRAVGVLLDNGDEVRAPTVVSACGVFNTWKSLVPRELTPQRLFDKMERIGHSCSFVYLFVGMKGSPQELKLRPSNIWVWPNRDYDAMIKEFSADPKGACTVRTHDAHSPQRAPPPAEGPTPDPRPTQARRSRSSPASRAPRTRTGTTASPAARTR